MNALDSMIETVEHWRSTGEWTAYVPELEIEELLRLLSELETIRTATRQLIDATKTRLIAQIEKPVLYGNTIYRVSSDTKIKLVNPASLASWLGSDIVRVFRLGYDNMRITQLREVAANRDIEMGAVLDTFFEITEDVRRLEAVPLQKASKKLREAAE